ncbi:MAG: T9SS type A sorting domain-containing protein, partial [Chitinophagaceae bacterium]
GSSVTLTATAAAGYTFTGWSGDASGTSASVSITMDANKNVTANFQAVSPTNYTLTTAVSPAGGGSITRSPDAASYASGTNVTLTATPAAGYSFSGWSGDATGSNSSITVTMTANKSVTANFTALPPGGTSTIRIEDNATPATGLCSFDGSLSSNSGANNTKVINLTNSTAKGITWSIGAASAGAYTFNWRYVNSSTNNVYTMKLIVNGVTVNSALGFPKTASSTTFANTTTTINLQAGNNTVRLESVSSTATADIDWLEVTGNGPTAASCPGTLARNNKPAVEVADAPVTLYPNPAVNKTVVGFTAKGRGPVTITVYDLNGKALMQQSFSANEGYQERVVQLRNFRSGTYYVTVQQCGNRSMQKLMVQ